MSMRAWVAITAVAGILVFALTLALPADLFDRWGSRTPPLRVLFIGNSYTYVNDLPHMLVKVAESDPQAPVRFEVDAVVAGGAMLNDHWQNPQARKALEEGHWDYVVLQEQSLWAMREDYQTGTYAALQNWGAAARRAQVKPLFFGSWARQPGSSWYTTDPWAPYLGDPETMQQTIDQQSDWTAGQFNIPVVHVGPAWRTIWRSHPEIPLYQEDGTHPAPAGTYLAALTFYHTLTGRSPTAVTWAPGGLSDDQARILREAAAP